MGNRSFAYLKPLKPGKSDILHISSQDLSESQLGSGLGIYGGHIAVYFTEIHVIITKTEKAVKCLRVI